MVSSFMGTSHWVSFFVHQAASRNIGLILSSPFTADNGQWRSNGEVHDLLLHRSLSLHATDWICLKISYCVCGVISMLCM